MRKGQPPLAYHRWLVPRSQRLAFAQRYPQYAAQAGVYSMAARPMYHPYGPGYQGGGHGQAYQMGVYGPPPPGKSYIRVHACTRFFSPPQKG